MDDILGNKRPQAFLTYLLPEACSVLVGGEEDFRAICDFLFFYSTSCTDSLVEEVYTKALFDLLKNYAYKWKLTVSHLITALENLGMSNKAFANEKLEVILSNRVEIVNKAQTSKGGRGFKFSMPKDRDFVAKRRDKQTKEVTAQEFQDHLLENAIGETR